MLEMMRPLPVYEELVRAGVPLTVIDGQLSREYPGVPEDVLVVSLPANVATGGDLWFSMMKVVNLEYRKNSEGRLVPYRVVHAES
jgi:hypothetical protein